MSRGCGRRQRTRWGATQVEPVALRPAGVPPILDAGTGPGLTVLPGAVVEPAVADCAVHPVVQVSSRTGTCYPSSRRAGSNSSPLITRSHIAPAGGFRLSTPPPVAASE